MTFPKSLGIGLTFCVMAAGPALSDCPTGPLSDRGIYIAYDDGFVYHFGNGPGGLPVLTIYENGAADPVWRLAMVGGVLEAVSWEPGERGLQLSMFSTYETDPSSHLPLKPETTFATKMTTYHFDARKKGFWPWLVSWMFSSDVSEIVIEASAMQPLQIGPCQYEAIPFSIATTQETHGQTVPHYYYASFVPSLGIEVFQGHRDADPEAERVTVTPVSIGYTPPG